MPAGKHGGGLENRGDCNRCERSLLGLRSTGSQRNL